MTAPCVFPWWIGRIGARSCRVLGFVKRLTECRLRVGERLSLLVAVGSDARHRLYVKAARHPKVRKYGQGFGEPVAAYQVTINTADLVGLLTPGTSHLDCHF